MGCCAVRHRLDAAPAAAARPRPPARGGASTLGGAVASLLAAGRALARTMPRRQFLYLVSIGNLLSVGRAMCRRTAVFLGKGSALRSEGVCHGVAAAIGQLVVLAHPDPGSFCASITRRWEGRVQSNHPTRKLRDLYGEGFDPVLKAHEQPGKPGFAPLAKNFAECQKLQRLDVLVFVYPVWFGAPLAMLKGYLERVVGSAVSFAKDAADQVKPLSDVRLVQISTSGSSEPWLAEKGIPSALHTIFDRYIAEVFGAKKMYRLHLDSIGEGMGYSTTPRLTWPKSISLPILCARRRMRIVGTTSGQSREQGTDRRSICCYARDLLQWLVEGPEALDSAFRADHRRGGARRFAPPAAGLIRALLVCMQHQTANTVRLTTARRSRRDRGQLGVRSPPPRTMRN